eukprot:TRINITY_DN53981_c0_g1_i1.p2 TRINITY_DN53981_c0_g1~~TRINITY_DN53981_c0_g1_i1.p2  ORF type:complete len:115 (-),score=6.34 TRINITY_DN53981_c0_g1_i1:40-384(-)
MTMPHCSEEGEMSLGSWMYPGGPTRQVEAAQIAHQYTSCGVVLHRNCSTVRPRASLALHGTDPAMHHTFWFTSTPRKGRFPGWLQASCSSSFLFLDFGLLSSTRTFSRYTAASP